MESSWTIQLLTLLSVLQILLRDGSAMNPRAPLASLLQSSQNCLIVVYTPSMTTNSELLAEHLAGMAVKTSTPIASYTAGAPNNTDELQFNVNCKLFLVYVNTAAAPSACEQLLTRSVPSASNLAAENERVIFIATDDISSCMESALLKEQDMDQVGHIGFIRPFVTFLELQMDFTCEVSSETDAKYEFKVAYRFKLFCPSSWACFLKMSLQPWRTFGKEDKANLNLWEVHFRFRGSPISKQEDLLAIASAPLYKLRIVRAC